MARNKILAITMAALVVVAAAEVMGADFDDEPPHPASRREARLQKLVSELRSESAAPPGEEVCFPPFAKAGTSCLIPSTSAGGQRASSKFKCSAAAALPPCPVVLDCEAKPDGKVAITNPVQVADGYYCECEGGHPVLVRCPVLGWVPWEKTSFATFSTADNKCV